MADKKTTLQLTWVINQYKVTAITNTTVVKPGEMVTVEWVDWACREPGWEVQIVDNDILAQAFGFFRGLLP